MDPTPFKTDGAYVILKTFGSHEAADLARANLMSHGVSGWIAADDAGGMYPNLTAPGGVRLMVLLSDLEDASQLLTDLPNVEDFYPE